MVFCDFSKAFDAFLLHKLDKHGIETDLLRWFKYYLTDREQKVKAKMVHHLVKRLMQEYHNVPCLSLFCFLYI